MELYDRLCSAVKTEEQAIETPPMPQEFASENDVSEQIKNETLICRLMLFFKSLFTGMDSNRVYGEMLVQRLVKYIEKKYPGFLNYKKRLVLTPFYSNIRHLKNVAEFFMPGIDLYEENPGSFYLFLSSLLLPDFYMKLEHETDPFLLPEEKAPSVEVRNSLLRRMEEVLQELTSSDRNRIYSAVCNIDWLRQFVRMPYERMMLKFMALSTGEYNAQLEDLAGDLDSFCRVLCNGRAISPDVLEAMFLFSIKTQLGDPNLNIAALTEDYVNKSVQQVRAIKRFLTEVPLRTITAVAHHDSTWSPARPEGAEDWFVKYKNECRSVFDQRYDLWTREMNKKILTRKVDAMLKCDELPLLPYRPWQESWFQLKFTANYSAGFMYAFFKDLYPSISKALRVLAVDGDFKVRDNRIEFTDALNEMNKLADDVILFAAKFGAGGDYTLLFDSVKEKGDRTVKAHQRLENTMTAANSEATVFAMTFTTAAAILANVLTGVVSENKNGKYDTINNIAAIEGHQNQAYRQRLAEIITIFNDSCGFIKDLSTLDA
ncbi:MAG: DUF5312 domain-containing protein [Treponemataceae bacterium]|nr:DUF5312 domain-containing protein [Treponemataceae bacterium]